MASFDYSKFNKICETMKHEVILNLKLSIENVMEKREKLLRGDGGREGEVKAWTAVMTLLEEALVAVESGSVTGDDALNALDRDTRLQGRKIFQHWLAGHLVAEAQATALESGTLGESVCITPPVSAASDQYPSDEE